MHDVVVVGIPLIAILAGILFSRSDTKDLRSEIRSEIRDLRNEIRDTRAEIKDLRREMNDQLGRIDANLRQF